MYRVVPIAVLIAVSIALAGCDRLGVFPERKDNGRYQLMKDDRGQILRLDTLTGNIVTVDPTTIPAERSSTRRVPASGAAAPAVTADVEVPLPSNPPPETADKPAETQALERPAQEMPAVDVRAAETRAVVVANPCAQIGEPDREFTLSSRADAFVDPGRPVAPVASLATGTLVQGVNVQGHWLLVRFHDQTWGDRSAYISCSSVLAAKGEGAGPGRPTN